MGTYLPAVDVAPGHMVEEVALGAEHTCARLDDGSVKCWGHNDFGQLGLGDDAQEMALWLPAIAIGTGRTPVHVEGGWLFTCLRYANERVKCWGANGSGQLGYGNRDIVGLDPADMGNALPFIDLGS